MFFKKLDLIFQFEKLNKKKQIIFDYSLKRLSPESRGTIILKLKDIFRYILVIKNEIFFRNFGHKMINHNYLLFAL